MECLYKNIERDVFIIPASNGKDCLYYSPLRDSSFVCSSNFLGDIVMYYKNSVYPDNIQLKNYLEEIERQPLSKSVNNCEIDVEDKAVIILTQKCNLSCRYCFAQSSRSTTVLSLDKLYKLIDYLFEKDSKKTKLFTFIGGGEPLICWDAIQDATEYIEKKSKKTNIPYRIGIITNATLLTEEKICWIARHQIQISVSTDILPDVQNTQRPYAFKKAKSFDKVDEAIKLLSKYQVNFKLRATITGLNVNRMIEMVCFVHKNYPFIKSLHLEPVTDSNENYTAFYKAYIENFFKSYAKGKDYGIKVTNSLTNSFYHLKKRFCLGELCITPSGDLVSCHRHSSESDPYFHHCNYGRVGSNVVVDDQLLRNAISARLVKRDVCESCFAKWHCAGGCASQNMVLSEEQKENFCDYVQEFIRNYLELQMSEIGEK